MKPALLASLYGSFCLLVGLLQTHIGKVHDLLF